MVERFLGLYRAHIVLTYSTSHFQLVNHDQFIEFKGRIK